MTWGCLCSKRPRKLWGAEDTQAVGVQSPPVDREEVALEQGLRMESTRRGQSWGASCVVAGVGMWRVLRKDLRSRGQIIGVGGGMPAEGQKPGVQAGEGCGQKETAVQRAMQGLLEAGLAQVQGPGRGTGSGCTSAWTSLASPPHRPTFFF